MDGYSTFFSELFVKYYTNYLGQQSTTTHSLGRWVRLSSNICEKDALGWIEVVGDGYAAFGDPLFGFTTSGVAAYGGNVCSLDNINGTLTDVVFTAGSNWPDIVQVGVWTDPTSISSEHFLMGFELSPPVSLQTGESLTFKNAGKTFVDRSILPRIKSYSPEWAEGPNTYATGDGSFAQSWRNILNWTTSAATKYPFLYTKFDQATPASNFIISLLGAEGVDWQEVLPSVNPTVIDSIEVELTTTNFEYFNDLADSSAFKVRSKIDLEFGSINVLKYANSIGITSAVPGGGDRAGWGGGPVYGAPIQLDSGTIPVITAGDFVFGLSGFSGGF